MWRNPYLQFELFLEWQWYSCYFLHSNLKIPPFPLKKHWDSQAQSCSDYEDSRILLVSIYSNFSHVNTEFKFSS